MKGLDFVGAALVAVMMLGPLAMAPAYGPYVEPGTAAEVTSATTPLGVDTVESSAETPPQVPEPQAPDAPGPAQ